MSRCMSVCLSVCVSVCSGDQVYMADEEMCQQYVLSDVGKIFYGNEHEISARPWNYGQVAQLFHV